MKGPFVMRSLTIVASWSARLFKRAGFPRIVTYHSSWDAILVGYGPTGRTVAAGLEAAGISYVVAEMNAATVRAERERGVPIVLADATRVTVLNNLGLAKAQLVVLAINDATATRRVAQLVSLHAPNAHILARASYNNEVAPLQRSGAHEVVPQELEASVEMLVRVLRRFLVADDEIGHVWQRVG